MQQNCKRYIPVHEMWQLQYQVAVDNYTLTCSFGVWLLFTAINGVWHHYLTFIEILAYGTVRCARILIGRVQEEFKSSDTEHGNLKS